MDVDISAVSLREPSTFVYPEQADYSINLCPVCSRAEDSFLLADICCDGFTSLETAFCRSCEHLYKRKLPSTAWYQRYYADVWNIESQPLAPSLSTRLKAVLKKVPLVKPGWRFVRQHVLERSANSRDTIFNPRVRNNSRAIEIFSFLSGVAENRGSFYRARPDIKKVLEIGCGSGEALQVFHDRGFAAYGTEASLNRAEYCRGNGLNVLNCAIDNVKPVEGIAPFDLAYSAHVLEHIVAPGQHMSQLAPLVREGGYLYIQVPYLMHEVNFVHQCHAAVHCHAFSPRSLALLLNQHGFTPVRMEVDVNIQILARKVKFSGAAFGGFQAYSNTADPRRFLDIFEALSEEQGKLLRMSWDHARVQIKRADDDTVVFDRALHFDVMPIESHSMKFSLNPARTLSFPVHFNHPGKAPPIYIKR